MTVREEIAKQRKPFVRAVLIGVALLVVGLAIQNARLRNSSSAPLDGTRSIGEILLLGIMLIDFVFLIVLSSLLYLRGFCPCCGKNITPYNFRRMDYCPYCGVALDAELSADGQASAIVHKEQRKDWLLHLACVIPSLLCFFLYFGLVILSMRLLYLEADRSGSARILGCFYAQACRNNPVGEKAMRRIFSERLSQVQTSTRMEKLSLPSDEIAYRQTVLDEFEKALLKKEGPTAITEDAANPTEHGTR